MRRNTRLAIINLLKKQGSFSVPELSRSLGMTRANVRHHIQMLEELGLISIIAKRRETRGRSAYIYGFSQKMLGTNLDNLSSAMLSVWLNSFGEIERDENLQILAQKLIDGFLSDKRGPRTTQLSILVNYLNLNHYKARWEARASGAVMVLGHCPFLSIINDHPELCTLDAYIIDQFTLTTCVQTVKLERLESGLSQCVFRIP